MTIILILFFLSLCAMIFIVGKRLIDIREKQIQVREDMAVDMPDLQDIKILVFKKLKRYTYITLVISIRLWIISSNYLKRKYKDLKKKTIELFDKYTSDKKTNDAPREVSKFLKVMSEYKKEVKKIKHRIKKEEGIE